MERIAFAEGRFCPWEDVRIPLEDRSIFFGDAVYDALIGKCGKAFDLRTHLHRLKNSAAALGISLPLSDDETEHRLREAASFFSDSTCFLYIQVSRTSPFRRHAYTSDTESRLLITAERMAEPSADEQIRVITQPDLRYSLCYVKTVNLLPNILAAHAAEEAGADEAVFIRDGIVTECAHSNISILKNGILFTHPADHRILPGITRRNLLDLCHTMQIPVQEKAFDETSLFDADDILVSSTSKFCRTVSHINGIAVGRRTPLAKTLCERLLEAFEKDMRSP